MMWGRSPFRYTRRAILLEPVFLMPTRNRTMALFTHWKSLKMRWCLCTNSLVHVRGSFVKSCESKDFQDLHHFHIQQKRFPPKELLWDVTTRWYKRPKDILTHRVQCGKNGLFTLILKRTSLQYTTVLRLRCRCFLSSRSGSSLLWKNM